MINYLISCMTYVFDKFKIGYKFQIKNENVIQVQIEIKLKF